MQQHLKKRKLYIETDCIFDNIKCCQLPYYPSQKIMKKYLLTEEEIVSYLGDGMYKIVETKHQIKEKIILPAKQIFKNQKISKNNISLKRTNKEGKRMHPREYFRIIKKKSKKGSIVALIYRD